MEKRAFDLLNCITVVPGALGAWRKKAIEAAGGISADTVAEDADLTIAIRRLGWRVSYDEEAVAWTEAPETAGQLIRQRFRWTFGTLQSFWKHGDTLLRPKYGTLGWIALPDIFVFQSSPEPKNMRSMIGEISGSTNWKTKIFGNAIQPSVPYFGRRSVSPCFQKDCKVPKVQRNRWRMSCPGFSGASVQAMASSS